MGAAKKMISKAKTSGGVPAKITAKQRIARKKNIAVARKSKKRASKKSGTGKIKVSAWVKESMKKTKKKNADEPIKMKW